MLRNYDSGYNDSVSFFVGTEVERTPAYGLRTLFVVGTHEYDVVMKHFIENDCEHIFFGANHSFNPANTEEWRQWENLITQFLSQDILCSLDIPLGQAEQLTESVMIEYNCFVPQLRVPIPNVKLLNYNTMIKIDDIGFQATNPGVWCHSLHKLMSQETFTPWRDYGLDKIIE